MALGPIAKIGVKLLKSAAKSSKKAAKATAKSSKKAAATSKKGVRAKIDNILKGGAITGLGGLGGFLSGRGGDDKGTTESTSTDTQQGSNTSSSNNNAAPQNDPFIGFQGLAEAISAAMPSLDGSNLRSNRNIENMASVIVRKDVELDYIDIGEDEQVPYIPAGTYMSTRIPEIGQLFNITDMLKKQVGMLDQDLDLVNANLKNIAKKIGLAIDTNRATARANERRRDEQDAENKNNEESPSKFKTLAKDAAGAAALGIAAKLSKYTNAAIAGASYAILDAMADNEEQSITEEQPIVEDESSALNEIINWIDKAESKDKDKTILQSAVGASISDETTAITLASAGLGLGSMGLGAVGATTAAATMGASAAVVGALGAGFVVGTVLDEQLGISDSIVDSISEGNSIDLGTMASGAAMQEKYQGKKGVELYADLFGEGALDLAEPPEEIIAAFKNIDSYDTLNKIANEYRSKYGTGFHEAMFYAVGEKGVESINNLIAKNIIDKKTRESKTNVTESVTKSSGEQPKPIDNPIRNVKMPEGYETLSGNPSMDKMYWGTVGQVEDLKKAGYSVSHVSNKKLLDPNLSQNAVAFTITKMPESSIKVNPQEIIQRYSVDNIVNDITMPSTTSFIVPNKNEMPNIEGDISEKQSQIIPLIMPLKSKSTSQKRISSGTQSRSRIESAVPSYKTSDSFLTSNLIT